CRCVLRSTMRDHRTHSRDRVPSRDVRWPSAERPDGRGGGSGVGWADAGEPLWRHVLGQHLRRLRLLAGQTLDETSRRAGVSPQYLSEMERGIKDPSSEMIAAVAGALGVTLLDLTVAVARELNSQRSTAQP